MLTKSVCKMLLLLLLVSLLVPDGEAAVHTFAAGKAMSAKRSPKGSSSALVNPSKRGQTPLLLCRFTWTSWCVLCVHVV